MEEVGEAILRTLCYRDLFDYPLTEDEVIRFLVEHQGDALSVRRTLAQLVAERQISKMDGFYHLPGRNEVVGERARREKISEKKYVRALRLSRHLRRIPWVKAVFLTGALAAGNAKEEDDIDFLVVTAKGRVWLVRLLSYLLFSVLRVKRKPGVEKAPDMVCLNMFLAENALRVPEGEQNLFSAHEVYLARPLWAREFTHLRFLGENPWVKKYLPNAEIPEIKIKAPRKRNVLERLLNLFLTATDYLLHRLQLYYMRKRRTREIVERERIFFHPIDLSRRILSAYRVKLYSLKHRNPDFSPDNP
ncbi:hypothetical protein GTO10_02105 [Candidatus Saccharibacteria bacterium]|nr:hypothetical protein [Candidatus Saccharibacteria bacterium]